jgi:formate-nitrite transporter family protein
MSSAAQSYPGTSELTPPLGEMDHVLGQRDAPLELVMFGDFQCPFCRAAQPAVRRVRETLGDRVVFVYRHLPIAEQHPRAEAAAEASEAAAAQGHFWEYHDALYGSHSPLADDELLAIARALRLDVERIARELSEACWKERVARDRRSARASGAGGTPTFFANGWRHDGSYHPRSLIQALEA